MNTLILDCSAGMNIYLICGEKEYKKCDYNIKKHTDELLLSVDSILNDAGIKINEINNIGVCIGPGSFTGIRVAVSVAKGISIGTGANVYTCNNFEIYSYDKNNKAVYLLDGFSDFVYTCIFDGEKYTQTCEHGIDIIEKIKTDLSNYEIIVQSEKLQNLLKSNEIASKIAQNNTILCFKDKILKKKPEILNQISPIYLRDSQAEIERNEKLKIGE